MAKTRSKDNTALSISDLEAEKRKLLISGDNPKRLAEIIKILDYFNWGIK